MKRKRKRNYERACVAVYVWLVHKFFSYFDTAVAAARIVNCRQKPAVIKTAATATVATLQKKASVGWENEKMVKSRGLRNNKEENSMGFFRGSRSQRVSLKCD